MSLVLSIVCSMLRVKYACDVSGNVVPVCLLGTMLIDSTREQLGNTDTFSGRVAWLLLVMAYQGTKQLSQAAAAVGGRPKIWK